MSEAERDLSILEHVMQEGYILLDYAIKTETNK